MILNALCIVIVDSHDSTYAYAWLRNIVFSMHKFMLFIEQTKL